MNFKKAIKEQYRITPAKKSKIDGMMALLREQARAAATEAQEEEAAAAEGEGGPAAPTRAREEWQATKLELESMMAGNPGGPPVATGRQSREEKKRRRSLKISRKLFCWVPFAANFNVTSKMFFLDLV